MAGGGMCQVGVSHIKGERKDDRILVFFVLYTSSIQDHLRQLCSKICTYYD